MPKRTFLPLLIVLLLISLVPAVNAAPSGTIDPPVGTVADNVLVLGGEEGVTITFKNSAGADITDVASTIQYITLAAANLNPSRTIIDLSDASWAIYLPTDLTTPRASGTVSVSLDMSAIYSPYSTTQTVYLYTWALGKPDGVDNLDAYTSSGQFKVDLKILRPGEIIKLTVKMKCQNVVGDTRVWFFFKATEAAYTTGNYPTDIATIDAAYRVNLYYSKLPGPVQTKYWLPLHNSYDPYDPDIGTGHNFDQHSWTRGSTTHAFAKGDKLVHQKPIENPDGNGDPDGEPRSFSFHICGVKFDDSNRDGLYDVGIEHGIGLLLDPSWVESGVTVTLLGPDQKTKATDYYPELSYPPPEDAHPDVLQTGENGLRGSYCFNLMGETAGKTYTFYVKEEVPAGRVATTPTLIGPITLVASAEGKRDAINNHFGNLLPKPVGGYLMPVNKLAVLAPYLALVGLVGAITATLIMKRQYKA